MESYHSHQIILPTDKRNPRLTLYATEDGQSIRVYYGLELIEVVPDDPNQMAYKMLAGRLYNAGVLVAKLEEAFKADRKTIRSWGQAILSRHPEHLARVLLGRSVNQKRTPAINYYVARRRTELLADGCPNYRATLIREIENTFEVKLSGETLRQIIRETDGHHAAATGESPASADSEEVTCLQNLITTSDDLLGQTVRFPTPQREQLTRLATPATIDAVLRWTGTEMEVHLVPQVNYPPKLRKIITTHLDELNANDLILPDGSGRPLRLRLARKEQISVRLNDIP